MSRPAASRASESGRTIVVACPNCRIAVSWNSESRWRPFCSERCRLIDLGEWFNEEHRISESGDGPPDS